MTRARLALILLFHLVVVAGLLAWAVVESRRQREEIEQSLITQASILAGSLGPGLAAASNALREFDEILAWKLLDNARLLAEIESSTPGGGSRLESIVEANGLDTVAFLGADGRVRRVLGEAPSTDMLRETEAILEGRVEELVLGSAIDADPEHVAASVAVPSGGAVLVAVHPLEARAFAQRLGVANLLDRLVGSGGVLYLSYREDPGPVRTEASWDGGSIPDRPGAGVKLRDVRGRMAFETEVPVDVPAGGSASLRVGLDGAPLEQATASGARRMLLVGIVLAGYAVATVSVALVSRLRGLERAESLRRLSLAETASRRSERLAAAGALTAGLAHEVRSPLNAIGLAAQRLERKHDAADECAVFARRIRQEVQRLEEVLRDFLDLARPMGDDRETVDLSTLAGEVLELLRPEAESRGIRLEPVEGRITVPVHREGVRRSVINLVRNAIEVSPADGRVRVVVDEAGGHGRLRVIDDGPGVDAELGDKVFEAFVTTRAGGSGLGLSLVKRVADEHGGSCQLVNRREGGAEAILRLPLEPEASWRA